MTDAARGRGRLQLLLIAALFFTPVLLAWVWYLNADRWRPEGGINYGEVLNPPQPVALSSAAGRADYLRGKWTLIAVSGPDCDTACQQRLHGLRQLRASLGRRLERVQGLFLTLGEPTPATRSLLEDSHAGLRHEALAADHALPAAMRAAGSANPAASGQTWLVDPLGNLMLVWPPELELKRVKKDLLRLLKVSSIG